MAECRYNECGWCVIMRCPCTRIKFCEYRISGEVGRE